MTDHQAKQYLKQALELYDTHGDFAQALEMCDTAIFLDPYFADAHNLRGVILEELGKPLNAVGAYRQALKLEPDFAEAQENLAALKAEFSGSNPWVPIAVFETLSDAYPLKSRLEEEGIKVIIPNEESIIFFEDMPEIEVLVRQSDEQAAGQILKNEPALIEEEAKLETEGDVADFTEADELFDDYSMEGLEQSSAEFETDIICSWCGSHKVGQTFPIPFMARKWKCQDCGRVWAKT